MRLLIIEDDDDIAQVIEATLRADGYDIDRVDNGIDGIWKAKEGEYGALILDILMPQMNGYQVCEALRADGVSTPILLLTAKVGEYDETDGLDAGADDYLRKPFSPNVLKARVRALLRRPGRADGPTTAELARGGVVLDPRTRACAVNGEAVELTARQAQVLEALLRSGDVPISLVRLVNTVWGIDFEGDPNVAYVYLGYLRQKIGKEMIENVRGLGYRIRSVR